jgi:hypothetical protein
MMMKQNNKTKRTNNKKEDVELTYENEATISY